jgi:hypothetical protein|tara:strand:- start:2349 stop:3329 length:981 start_codon:yes stop_codon:yes gene_type:complete
MASLAEIRAKLLEQEKGGNTRSNSYGGDNAIYAFWNIPEGQSATLRFLPDGDETNTYFWRERQMIRIPFSGVAGGDEHKPVTVTVPCMEMWSGETCPVHAEIRPWFKDPSMEDMARKYWKKRSYLFQGYVVDSPLKEDSVPENPVRRFIINPSIFNIIKAALMDPDFPEIPTDYEQGTDFKLTKTQKGQYADYSTSNWARKERGLTEEERNVLATNGLHNLDDFMPKKPTAEGVNAIFEMFEASVDGQLYDPARFGQFYRPAGVNLDNIVSSASTSTPAPVAVTAPAPAPAPQAVAESAPAPAAPAADAGQSSAQDILAAIRARKN